MKITNTLDKQEIRAVVELRQNMQKMRIAFGNRLKAIKRGDDEVALTEDDNSFGILGDFEDSFSKLERDLDKFMYDEIKDMAIVKALIGIKGIGPILATKLVVEIDIAKANTISALWKFAGQGVTEGAGDRLRKGEKAPYNIRLKTIVYLVSDSFVKSRSPYRDIYDKAKVFYTENRPDWTKLHVERAARRKMVKVFLAHFWETWRIIEGLPVREPYAMDRTEHTTKLEREDFGWKV